MIGERHEPYGATVGTARVYEQASNYHQLRPPAVGSASGGAPVRVMVTGGTGFIGAHSVKALAGAGHEVRLLVRDPARIEENVKPLGVGHVDYVLGDMCDRDAVGRAMDGCEAVLHCAALVALDRRRAAEVLQRNPLGARTVIDAAIERHLDPIVHVSSTAAVFSPDVPVLHPDLPPAQMTSAYGQSKSRVETYARSRQAEGAPITITYPSGVAGPPAGSAFGEVADALVSHLKTGMIVIRDASWSIVDVRDVGAIHAALMQPGKGPRRYMCGGHHMTMTELAERYRELTGRRFPVIPTPPAALRALGKVMDAVTRVVPVDSVFTAEGMSIFTRWVPTDDHRVGEELGVAFRDPQQTMADALRGLYAAGRVRAKHVGRLATERTAPSS